MKKKTYKVSKQKAIEIVANHNAVPPEVAKTYSDNELREVLKHLKLKADF